MSEHYSEDDAVATVATLTRARIASYVRARIVTPLQTGEGPRFRELDLVRMELLCDLSEQFDLDEDALVVVMSLLDQLHDARADLRELAGAIASQPSDIRARIGESFVKLRTDPHHV